MTDLNTLIDKVAAWVSAEINKNLVIGNLVYRHYEPVVHGVGDAITVNMAPSDGVSECGVDLSRTVNLNRTAESTFTIPDVELASLVPQVFPVYAMPSVAAITEKIESQLASCFDYLKASRILSETIESDVSWATDRVLESMGLNPAHSSSPRHKLHLVVDSESYGIIRQLRRFSDYDGKNHLGECLVHRSRNLQPNNSLLFSERAACLITAPLPRCLPGTGILHRYILSNGFGMRISCPDQVSQDKSLEFTCDVLFGCWVLDKACGIRLYGAEKSKAA